MYDLQHYGVPKDKIGPFKNLEAADVSTIKGAAVYLSQARKLVKEIEKYLPNDYKQLTQSAKDSSVGTAFNDMADRFLLDNPGHANRASESLTVSTLYNKYYNPCPRNKNKLSNGKSFIFISYIKSVVQADILFISCLIVYHLFS